MKQELLYLFLLFFIFSFLGWCMEVTLMFRKYHRFINRGFLTGPWLPIYGSGAVMITVAVQAFAPIERGFIASFFFSFVICGIWEYS
ncbi:MAG: putative ABC transporter permease, partial [Lachnospiraceae bacterium]|nr:putative ABC transporter permease [Lachnospiraceae bacterium]